MLCLVLPIPHPPTNRQQLPTNYQLESEAGVFLRGRRAGDAQRFLPLSGGGGGPMPTDYQCKQQQARLSWDT